MTIAAYITADHPWLATALAAAVIVFALGIIAAIYRHSRRTRRSDDPTDYEGA